MSVVLFPQEPRVVISSRQVLETRYETVAGTEVIRHSPPLEMYFLDYVDEGGFTCCVWDGTTRAAALSAAHDWAAEGIVVRDQSNQTRGR